jgi:hypothetical protein
MTEPVCTCPRLTGEHGEAVRYTDQLCPVHKPRNCQSCGAPIVQTVELAREIAAKAEKEKG